MTMSTSASGLAEMPSTNEDAIASRPRVLVVGPGSTQVGGVTTFIQMLLTSPLVSANYEMLHLDTTRAAEDAASTNRLSLRNLTYLLRQIWQLVWIAIRQHPFAIHIAVTSGWSFWKGAVFILMGRALRMRVVAHLHGGLFRDFYLKNPRPVQCVIGCLWGCADVVIALSDKWRRFLLDEVRADLNVAVLPNAVDAQFAAIAEQDNDEFPQSENIVLFVGRLARAKGVFDILRAAPLVLSTHKDALFVLAGGASGTNILQEMQTSAVGAGLGDSVQFLGEVTGQSKVDVFRRATVFVLPSYIEGLPYALLEAMAVGLPVVTTPVGAIPEIIHDGCHGFLIQPGDYVSLAERITELIRDKPLSRRMGQANKRVIRDLYLPDRAMAQLVAIYDSLQSLDWNGK